MRPTPCLTDCVCGSSQVTLLQPDSYLPLHYVTVSYNQSRSIAIRCNGFRWFGWFQVVAAALKAQCPRTPKRQMRVGNACAFTRRRRQSPVWGPAPLLARLRPPWPVLPLALDVFCGLATPGAVQRFRHDAHGRVVSCLYARRAFFLRACRYSPPVAAVSGGFEWFQVVSGGFTRLQGP